MMCSTAERRGGGIRHASSPFVRQGSLSMDLGATQSIFSRAMDVKLKFSPIYIGGGLTSSTKMWPAVGISSERQSQCQNSTL